jgi:hypothetical protein
MSKWSGKDRRTVRERRRLPRARRCVKCQAHLVVDRRGPTVVPFSPGTYTPAAARMSTAAADVLPTCPVCGAHLKIA